MNVEHRTLNIEHRMGGAQSRRQFCKLIQAIDPHTERKDYAEEEKGFLLDIGVLVLGRCHLIRFGLLSDYEQRNRISAQ